MKIKIEKNPQVKAMFALMADKDYTTAQKAREAFAAFIQQPIMNVIESEAVLGNLFSTQTYDYGTPSSIPLAPLFDIRQSNYIKVWAQTRAGGLATSTNCDVSELMVMTYGLESAVAFKLDYIKAARVDVVAAYLQRMAQEVLYKQELNSATVLMTTAANAQFPNKSSTAYQVIRSQTQGTVVPQDVSKLTTLMSRVNSSWVGGTPVGSSRSITSLVGSPEFLEQIRNSAFQPVNSQAATTAIPSSDKFRDDIYNAVGNPSWYGSELICVYDMGVGYNYNILFGSAAGSNAYVGYAGNGTATFSPYNEQVVLGIDKRQEFLVRLVESNPTDSSTFTVGADNQWSNRSEEIGFWGRLREGRVSLDGRNVVALLY